MTKVIDRAKSLGERVCNRLFGFRRDRRGNVAPLIAVMMVPMLGVLGMAAEGSNWMFTHRAAQNAADSSVVAAANAYENYAACSAAAGCSGTGDANSYNSEGQAVAQNLGFTNGIGNATVAVTSGYTCPPNVSTSLTAALGTTSCFRVDVTKKLPLYLLAAMGFNGNTLIGASKAQMVAASAIAGPVGIQVPVCVLGLQSTGNAITLHGSPNADLGDCTIFSDSGATCTGHNSGAFIGGAVGTDNNCGIAEFSNQNNVPDPYASAASHGTIPPNNCTTSTPVTVPAGSTYTAASLAAAISNGNSSLVSTDSSGMTYVEACGEVTLGGNVALTSGDLAIVFESSAIATNSYTLSTSGTPGSAPGMTLIYQGTGQGAFDVSNSNGGTINISNPTDLTGTSTWNGFTIYDPVDTSMTYKGNQPAWDLTGIAYFPNVNMDWRGIIGKANSGFECFDLVVNSLQIDGTAQMFSPNLSNPTGQCGLDNVKPPTVLGYRYALVG